MAGEKTEKATPKKRSDERKKGNVLMSQDVVAVASMFMCFFLLKQMLPMMAEGMADFFSFCMQRMAAPVIGEALDQDLIMQFLLVFFKACGPLLAISILVAVASTFAQTRMLVTFSSLKPKFSKLNPFSGLKKLFSLRSIIEVIKGSLKITILLAIIYKYLTGALGDFPKYLYADIGSACGYLMEKTFGMIWQIAMAFTAISAFDYLYQWWDHERQMKMSKQEIKEEYKQMEGDPQIKGKIKEVQRRLAQARMMQAVPQADVVVRNPTHFAVALRYDTQKDAAPIVLAKGQDYLALRIVAIAEENGVTVLENRPLARSLYASAELGQEIPSELYGAVAEVMVYLYKIGKKHAKR